MNQLLNDAAADQRSSLLREAVRRGTRVVVSHHGPDGWRTLRTKFVGYDESCRSLVLSPLVSEAGTDPVELAPGELLGVTFRHGHKKCMFSTALQRFADHQAGGTLTRAAAWLNWPDHLRNSSDESTIECLRRRGAPSRCPCVLVPQRTSPRRARSRCRGSSRISRRAG